MQVDLAQLKQSIEDELSKLEQEESRLKEGLVTVEGMERLASELKAGQVDSSLSQKPDDTFESKDVPGEMEKPAGDGEAQSAIEWQ